MQEPGANRLNALSRNARDGQWILDEGIDWDRDVALPRWFPRRLAIALVSQFLYGERATTQMCERLIERFEDAESKICLRLQIADEDRHAEAYTRYLTRLGDIAPPDTAMADAVAGMDDWQGPLEGFLVAYHIVLEGEALRTIEGLGDVLPCDLFQAISRRVAVDEARHVAFGRMTLQQRLPRLNFHQRRAIYRWVRDLWRDCAGGTLSGFSVPELMTRGLRRRWLDEGWIRHRRSMIDVGLLAPAEIAAMEA